MESEVWYYLKRKIGETFFVKAFHIMAMLLYAALFCTSMFITGVNREDRVDEYIIIEHNSVWRTILIIAVFGGAMLLFGLLYDKMLYKWKRNILLGITCVTVLFVGIYWISASGTEPIADQGMICAYANALNDGDFNGIWKGRYLARHDHLLGLTTLLRGLFLVFGRGNYMAFQYFNALMLPLIVFSGCQIVRKLSGNNGKVEMYYLVLIATCFPMYAYTAFVYGEVSSTAVVLAAAWLLLSCLEKFSVPKAVSLALIAGIAVQLRKNTLIILIAFGIVVLVRLLRKFDWKTLVTGLCVLAGVLLVQSMVKGIYRDVWDEEARAIPAFLYVAMGLHEPDGHPGWFDNYVDIVFAENGDDVEVATEMAFENIKGYLDRFREDPGYMWYFYKTKINTQWQAPMYQSIVMNNNIVREQSRIVQMIYNEEPLGGLIKLYMKAFQLFMYGCILLWLLTNWEKKMPIEKYVLLIAVFGGFLFSIIWEAKTRYIFPYLLLMIPYFSMGLKELTERLAKLLMKFLQSQTKIASQCHRSFWL